MRTRRGPRHVGHRLRAVHDEVDQHLLQLHAIAAHRRRRRREFDPHVDAMPLQFAPHQFDRLLDDLVQIERRGKRGRAFSPSTRIRWMTSLARFASRIICVIDCFASARSGRRAVQPAQRGIAARDDRRDRLRDLVRDRRGQFAEHRDARHVREFGGRARERFLRELGLGDVHQRADVLDARPLAATRDARRNART